MSTDPVEPEAAPRKPSKRQPKPTMVPQWRFRAISPTGRIHDVPVIDKQDAIRLARVFGYVGTLQWSLRTEWEDVMTIGEPDPGVDGGQPG